MFKRKRRRSREFKKNAQVIDFEEARRKRQQKRQSAAPSREGSKSKQKQASQRAKIRKSRRRLISTAIMLIIVAVVGLSAYNIYALKAQQEELMAENEALKNKKDRLTEELAHVDSPEYIEQQARMQLRLIMPGETLFILPKVDEEAAASDAQLPGEEATSGGVESGGEDANN